MNSVQVTVFEVGRLRFDLAEAYGAEAARGVPAAAAVIPVQAFHLALPGRSVMVDAPHYDERDTPDAYLLPGYRPPPPLEAQLRDRGIAPEDVTDVIITHLHFDHYGALAHGEGGAARPTFPNARHYLGRGDWPPAADEDVSLAARTVGVVEAHGLLELVDGDADLGDGLGVVAAPGESPGHQLARAQLGSDVVYVVGDLFHHALEFRGNGPDVRWVDAKAMAGSKRALATRAADERARVYISHITGAYRVARSCGGFKWVRSA
jgi:glyoxylase-like metal-dependent hydrolase (beta-lactamase superfamily II)